VSFEKMDDQAYAAHLLKIGMKPVMLQKAILNV